ncbi:MAG: Leucine-, isoleucine-, valine-, threonine-, and alanine-binding protein [Planctomycetes bacterium]|nr:Leucine-, isoleucine-, valine-, threonine-, and alanine-binding protein [Planctomycetota bacterium]
MRRTWMDVTRNGLWTGLAAGIALAVAACGKDPAPAPSGGAGAGGGAAPASSEPIRIGVGGPITGPQAKNGSDLVDGTTMAVEEWNAKGGIRGRKIEFVARDDEADPKKAPTAAAQLIDQGVVGVIGHFNSGSTIPASKAYADKGIVCITPASTNEFVTDRGLPTVFRVCGRDDQQAARAAKFVAEEFKAKKVAIFDNRTAYGKGLADNFANALKGRVEITVREGFDEKERNFKPYLNMIKEKGADIWYFGGIFEQAAPLLIQARGVGITAPMMSGDGVHGYVDDFLKKVGEGANGTFTTFPPTDPAFIQRYKARFAGKEPGPYAIFSYVAANVLLHAIHDSGSEDGRKVAEALHKGSWDSPLGKIEFDAKGDVKGPPEGTYVVWVVKDGAHVVHSSK